MKRWVCVLLGILILFGGATTVYGESNTVESAESTDETTETTKPVDSSIAVDETVSSSQSTMQKATRASYYAKEKGMTWVNQSDYIDVGISYESNDPNILFQ